MSGFRCKKLLIIIYILYCNGKTIIFEIQVSSIDDLEDGGEYVASSGDIFKKIEYTHTDSLRPKRTSSIKPNTSVPKPSCPDFIIPRIVIVIRNGLKPRKVCI